MLLAHLQYHKPSKLARILAVLDELSRKSDLSQLELGKRLGMSGAMVNSYLKLLQDQKLLTYEVRDGKRYRYVLTREGEHRRQEMFSSFSSETIRIYTALKKNIQQKLEPFAARGLTRLALFGAAETCEVVLSALQETSFIVVTLLDNDSSRQGRLFHGHVIAPPLLLENVECQAVVITTFARQDEIQEQIAPVCKHRGLKIVRL